MQAEIHTELYYLTTIANRVARLDRCLPNNLVMLVPLFPDNSLVVEVEKFKMENDFNSEVKNEMFHTLNCGFEIK